MTWNLHDTSWSIAPLALDSSPIATNFIDFPAEVSLSAPSSLLVSLRWKLARLKAHTQRERERDRQTSGVVLKLCEIVRVYCVGGFASYRTAEWDLVMYRWILNQRIAVMSTSFNYLVEITTSGRQQSVPMRTYNCTIMDVREIRRTPHPIENHCIF